MKIGVVGLRGFPDVMGGVEKHCEELYPQLVKKGLQFVVCRRTPYLSPKKRVKYDGITFLDIWCPKNKTFEAIIHTFMAVIILRLKGIKYIHCHNIGPGLVIPFASLLGCKTILTYHSQNYLHHKWNYIEKRVLWFSEYLACVFSNKIISISEYNKKLIHKRVGKRAVVINNGVSFPVGKNDNDYLRRLGLKKEKYFLAVGRFVPEKGFVYLIDAYEKLNTHWKLVIAGAADHTNVFSKTMVARSKVNPNVILPGFIGGGELGALYENAGAFIQTSFAEGQPIALLEAMSYNRNVLLSDIPAHREILKDDELFFTPGDIEGLCTKMKDITTARRTFRQLPRYREKIATEYTWENVASKTYSVFAELLSDDVV